MFKDYFSSIASLYARYRPHYPKELFDYLVSLVKVRNLAWDCATGNGQVAVELAEYFKQVIATDASQEQIKQAVPNEKVVYRVERAESTSLDDASVDLLCVAQALHWFEFEVFYREAKRVLKREGVIAVWAYHNVILPTTALQEIVNHYYHEIVGPYWPAEIKLLEEKYETIPFPFAEINPPAFVMKVNWSLENFVGYLESWSSSRRYFLDKGKNPLDEIREKLENAWGDPASEKLVSWPLFLRVGRKIESSPS